MKVLMLGSASYKSSLTYFRLVAIARQLGQLGWDVTVVVPSADKYNDFTPEPHASIDGVRLVQPWQPATRNILINLLPYLCTALAVVLRTRTELVCIYKPTPITIIGFAKKLFFRTPVIVDLDDLGSEVMQLEGQPKFMVRLVRWCEQYAVRHASAVVVASTYLEDRIKKQYPAKPILVLSNGVDLDEYPFATLIKPRKALYYFGALNRFSIIEPLLRALPPVIAAVPGVEVLILGGGAALDETKRAAVTLGIADHIRFTGWIEKDAIRDYVKFADLALCVQPDIPTVRAASNLKVFQYMALGSVPLVSDVGDLPKYVAAGSPEAVGLAVSTDDLGVLSKLLIDLLKNDRRRTDMAMRARARVAAEISDRKY